MFGFSKRTESVGYDDVHEFISFLFLFPFPPLLCELFFPLSAPKGGKARVKMAAINEPEESNKVYSWTIVGSLCF